VQGFKGRHGLAQVRPWLSLSFNSSSSSRPGPSEQRPRQGFRRCDLRRPSAQSHHVARSFTHQAAHLSPRRLDQLLGLPAAEAGRVPVSTEAGPLKRWRLFPSSPTPGCQPGGIPSLQLQPAGREVGAVANHMAQGFGDSAPKCEDGGDRFRGCSEARRLPKASAGGKAAARQSFGRITGSPPWWMPSIK